MALGFLGAGGTTIALPVLVYLVGLDAHAAVAVSIVLVGGASAYGAVLNAREGFVDWRAVAVFAPAGVAGAVLGSAWSYMLSGRTLLICFGGLVTVVAVRMMLEGGETTASSRLRLGSAVVAGFGIGVLTGVLGNGGGFLLVPGLVYLAGLPMRRAVGTSLLISAINSAAAFAGHAARQKLPWRMVLVLLACTIIGITAGVALSHRTDPGRLRHYFAWMLLVLAGYLLWRNW
jgi:hypothetical protein